MYDVQLGSYGCALLFRNRYYRSPKSGTLIQSNNITTINSTFCNGSPPTLSQYDGALVCANGINPAGGMLQGSWSNSCAPLVLTGLTRSGKYLSR